MAEHLNFIAKHFTEQTVEFVINKMPENEKEQLTETLASIRNELTSTVNAEAKKKKRSKTVKKESRESIFYNDVIPKMRSRLSDFEKRMDVCERNDVELSFDTSFGKMSIEEKVEVHKQMLEFEDKATVLCNFERFYRGKLYLSMKEDYAKFSKETRGSIADFFKSKFDLTYNTISSHVLFYKLIRNFPRLIVCLPYNEMLGNAKRIFRYFGADGKDFASQVETNISIINGRKDFTITRRNVSIQEDSFNIKNPQEDLEDTAQLSLMLNSDADDDYLDANDDE